MSEQRRKILECACELYLSDGFDGFSMRKLAKAVGVTAPALYRHYSSKESVLLDVVSESYKVLTSYLVTALAGPSPFERFQMAGNAYLEFALDHPRMYEMIYAWANSMGLDGWPEEITAQACAVGQFFNDRVRECMDDGALEEGEPERVSVTLWAHAHGLISIYLKGMLDEVDGDDAFRALYQESGRRAIMGCGTERLRAFLEETAGAPVD